MRNLFSRKEKQVKFVPKEDFLHERVRYLKGKVYKGPTSIVTYFEKAGWLEGSEVTPPPSVVLDIQNGRLGHEERHG